MFRVEIKKENNTYYPKIFNLTTCTIQSFKYIIDMKQLILILAIVVSTLANAQTEVTVDLSDYAKNVAEGYTVSVVDDGQISVDYLGWTSY